MTMADSKRARLGSSYLEDMAAIALLARPNASAPNFYPVLNQARRVGLRSRLKKISRYDWPATVKDDALLRRGYTLRQCFRLVVALQLIDAHLAASIAVPIAADNELTTMRIIANRLRRGDQAASEDDPLAVVALGELWEPVDPPAASAATLRRIRVIERGALPALWSNQTNLDFAGPRLVLDFGAAAAAVWMWMKIRRLMPSTELDHFLKDLERSSHVSGYNNTRAETPG